MKTYLVELESRKFHDRPLAIIEAKNEDDSFKQAYRASRSDNCVEGIFTRYLILRNPSGYLYLADLDGNAILPSG